MQEFLVCIDSDGTAMDTMTIKHVRCFGPSLIETFNLKEYESKILERWNEINLYSKTRGINRFLGLNMMLKEINEYHTIEELDAYSYWCENTSTFSNSELQKYYEENPKEIFKRVLDWSIEVNKRINELPIEDKNAFDGVKETLEYIYPFVDIAIVSSANKNAVKEEWEKCDLLKYVTYFMTQEDGTKEECIAKLIDKGYERKKVIMLGDSLEDLKASDTNNILYYSIKPQKEVESWREFKNTIFDLFLEGDYVHNQNKTISNNQLLFVDDKNNELIFDILFTYHSEKFNKDYVCFMSNETNEEGNYDVCIASYTKENDTIGDLEVIDNEEEFKEVEEVLNSYMKK